MKRIRKLCDPQVLMALSNTIFLIAGVGLLVVGYWLWSNRTLILLSELLGLADDRLAVLPEPIFYYVALGLSGAGLAVLCAAIIGCWAGCWSNYCTLTLYFLVVFCLLILELVLCVSISIWPQCLGLTIDADVTVKALQGRYGVPGHERFTAAIDLAQTKFNCCAINSDIEFDTSLWKLQAFANKDLTVPLTCCILHGDAEQETTSTYLDPKPANQSLCQALQRNEYSNGRHTVGCLEKLQTWYYQHYTLFLGIALVIVIAEFVVLLTIIYSCATVKMRRRDSIHEHIAEFERKVNDRRNLSFRV